MSRSIWKPLYIKKKNNESSKNYFFRKNIIHKEHLGLTTKVYNGIKFYEITIKENMLNHKFGEFSPTKKIPLHKKKNKKKINGT